MTRPTPPRRRGLAALLAAVLPAAALLAACGSDHATPSAAGPSTSGGGDGTEATPKVLPAAVSTLAVVGTEYTFELHATDTDGRALDLTTGTLPAGWTRVTFENRGDEAHQVMFARVKDGVDMAQLAATAGGDSSGSAAIEFVDMLGGVSYIGPGQSIDALVDLPAGIVMAMCYVPDAHGVAHALSGMTTMLSVADGPATADEPADGEVVQGTIAMTPDGYRFPESLTPGWYHVVNQETGEASTGLHELSILGLDEPITDDELPQLLDDLATGATPAVPLVALGGMGALSGGFDGYLHLELDPGPYLAVDFMPDPGNPRPHLLDGYATTFER